MQWLKDRRAAILAGLSTALLWTTLLVTWTISFFLFTIVNRTTVLGSRHRAAKRRLLIVSNHQTLIDSFLVGFATYLPSLLRHPTLAASHLADARNFMTHPLLRFVYQALRVIPVQSNGTANRSDLAAFRAAVRVLNHDGMLHAFIEGTRSHDEELLAPKVQIGSMAILSGASVRPVLVSGGHQLFPYRKKPGDPPATWWRLFGLQTEWLLDVRWGTRPVIIVGDELTPEEILQIAGEGKHRERAQRVSAAIMDRIREMKTNHENQRGCRQ